MDKKIRKAGLLILWVSLLGGSIYKLDAQSLVFEKYPDRTIRHPHFGPNKTHFLHPFLSAGLILPSTGPAILHTTFPFSLEADLGYRYKFKMTRRLAWITEAAYNHLSFNVLQEQGKNYPDSLIHRSQSIRSNGLYGGVFLRFRLGQNGDYLGNYIDLGITGLVPLLGRIKTVDRQASGLPEPVPSDRIRFTGFQELNRPSAGFKMRIGFDRISLTVSRRFTRWLADSANLDLPLWQAGAEISLVTY